MTDIVNELRALGELRQDETCRDTFENDWDVCMLALNAADEIERLRDIIQLAARYPS